MLNDGSGAFDELSGAAFGNSYGQSPRLRDLNQDGAPDLINTLHYKTELYLNDGTGGFYDVSHQLPADYAVIVRVAFLDAEGDGDVDLVLLVPPVGDESCKPSAEAKAILALKALKKVGRHPFCASVVGDVGPRGAALVSLGTFVSDLDLFDVAKAPHIASLPRGTCGGVDDASALYYLACVAGWETGDGFSPVSREAPVISRVSRSTTSENSHSEFWTRAQLSSRSRRVDPFLDTCQIANLTI